MTSNWQKFSLIFNDSNNKDSSNQSFSVFVFLLLILSVLFSFTLGFFPLHVPDTARYAEIPREMLETGNYFTPHLNYLKYFEKPPLFYWIQAINLKIFGVNIFAANLANALMALLCCLSVYFAGNKLYGRRSGFLSAIVLATSVLFFAMSRFTTLDLAFTFFLSVSLFCFILGANTPLTSTALVFSRRDWYMWLMYANVGLAVMVKGLIGIVFPVIIIFLWVAIFREWRNLKTYRPISGLILFLLIAAPWHILICFKHPEFFRFYFIEQHFLRYFTSYAGRVQPWWFFSAVLIGGFYPWTIFVGQAIRFHLQRQLPQLQEQSQLQSTFQCSRSHYKTAVFLLLWAISIYIFFAFSNSRLIPYLLPIFPPLAMLVGSYFAIHWEQKSNNALGYGFYALLLVNIIIGVVLLWLPHFTTSIMFKISWVTVLIYIVATMLVIGGGVMNAVVYYRCGIAKGFSSMVVVMFFTLLSATPLIGYVVAQKTTLPFAKLIKVHLKPQDEVVSFYNYYQDLPYYLARRITVVDYRGELEFGMNHQSQQNWMIDQNTLWQRWFRPIRIYMIMDKDDYVKVISSSKKYIKNSIFLLTTYRDKVLVTNQPPTW